MEIKAVIGYEVFGRNMGTVYGGVWRNLVMEEFEWVWRTFDGNPGLDMGRMGNQGMESATFQGSYTIKAKIR